MEDIIIFIITIANMLHYSCGNFIATKIANLKFPPALSMKFHSRNLSDYENAGQHKKD